MGVSECGVCGPVWRFLAVGVTECGVRGPVQRCGGCGGSCASGVCRRQGQRSVVPSARRL